MALTAPQQTEMDKVKATKAEIETAVQEIQNLVQQSLSIQNVGGGHIFNLCQALKGKLEKLDTEIAAVENA